MSQPGHWTQASGSAAKISWVFKLMILSSLQRGQQLSKYRRKNVPEKAQSKFLRRDNTNIFSLAMARAGEAMQGACRDLVPDIRESRGMSEAWEVYN